MDDLLEELKVRVALGITLDTDWQLIHAIEDAETLEYLSHVLDDAIRSALILNPYTPDPILLGFYQDDTNSYAVRHSAWDMLAHRSRVPLFEFRNPEPTPFATLIDPYDIVIPPDPSAPPPQGDYSITEE